MGTDDKLDNADVRGVLVIGYGTNFMKVASYEILLAAAPDEEGRIASIRCRPNGDVLINERKIGNDREVVEGLRTTLCRLANILHVEETCTKCGQMFSYPIAENEAIFSGDAERPRVCLGCRSTEGIQLPVKDRPVPDEEAS